MLPAKAERSDNIREAPVAYHIPLSIWQGTAVALIVRLGTMVPGPPSNIGTYQFFTVIGLSLFGVDRALAAGFSFVVFFVLTFPLWVIGTLAFLKCGLSLSDPRSWKQQHGRIPNTVHGDGDTHGMRS